MDEVELDETYLKIPKLKSPEKKLNIKPKLNPNS